MRTSQQHTTDRADHRRGKLSNSRGTKAVVDHGAPVWCSKCQTTDADLWFATPGHTSCAACRKAGVQYVMCLTDEDARRFHAGRRNDKPWMVEERLEPEVLPMGPIVRIDGYGDGESA